jgi:hypothetical protein
MMKEELPLHFIVMQMICDNLLEQFITIRMICGK